MLKKCFLSQKGSATIEAMLIMPMIVVFMALLVMVLKINVARVAVNHSAIENVVSQKAGRILRLDWELTKRQNSIWLGTEKERVFTEGENTLKTEASALMTVNMPFVKKDMIKFESSVYASFFGDLYGKDSGGNNKSVWDLLPFERGREIEKIFGGNLPDKFETIDTLTEDGMGISYLSIDVTAATYSSGEEVYKKIVESVDKLNNFSGDEKEGVLIEARHVKKKKLVVVIPANAITDTQREFFEKAEYYAIEKNVILEVVEYQEKN